MQVDGAPGGVDLLRDLERKAGLVRGELGDPKALVWAVRPEWLYPPAPEEAAGRTDLLLFDLPRMVNGE